MKNSIKKIFIILSISLFFSLFESVIVAGGDQSTCSDIGLCGDMPHCSLCSSCSDLGECGTYPNCYSCSGGTSTMLIWIKDPNGNLVVNGAVMGSCSATSDTTSCYHNYYSCNVNGMYTGQVYYENVNVYSPWTNLWWCGPYCGDGLCDSGENSVSCPQDCFKCGNGICDVGENCTNCPRDCGCTEGTNCCGSDSPFFGSCKDNCGAPGICNFDGECGVNENCECPDCFWKQDSCNDGLVCNPIEGTCEYPTCNYDRTCKGQETCKNCPDCGCTEGTTCCDDGICREPNNPLCGGNDMCNFDEKCEQGESCLCPDCYGKKDSCGDDLICNSTSNMCQCPSDKPYWCIDHCDMSPDCTCGNGILDLGEDCMSCPEDAGCLLGTRCCQDGTCGNDCNGPGCDLNGECDRNETYYETCDCTDCLYQQDRCILGDICIADGGCGCNSFPDGICTSDPSCQAIDPDCNCNENGICEPGETQNGCSDCSTKVILSPSRMYPGEKVNVTVYFNDSRYVAGENAKIVLYIDNTPWKSCAVHNSKWMDDMKWDRSTTWTTHDFEGEYEGQMKPRSSMINIFSVDGYARIEFDCTVPADISQGIHKLSAVPYTYSKEIMLASAETEFVVSDSSLKMLKIALDIIKLIF